MRTRCVRACPRQGWLRSSLRLLHSAAYVEWASPAVLGQRHPASPPSTGEQRAVCTCPLSVKLPRRAWGGGEASAKHKAGSRCRTSACSGAPAWFAAACTVIRSGGPGARGGRVAVGAGADPEPGLGGSISPGVVDARGRHCGLSRAGELELRRPAVAPGTQAAYAVGLASLSGRGARARAGAPGSPRRPWGCLRSGLGSRSSTGGRGGAGDAESNALGAERLWRRRARGDVAGTAVVGLRGARRPWLTGRGYAGRTVGARVCCYLECTVCRTVAVLRPIWLPSRLVGVVYG